MGASCCKSVEDENEHDDEDEEELGSWDPLTPLWTR